MDPMPRQALQRLLETCGGDLWHDRARCEALLEQFCGPFPDEHRALLAVLRSGVLEDLVAWEGLLAPAEIVRRLLPRLPAAAGLPAEDALWALESWGLALGVFEASPPTETASPPPPEASPETPGLHGGPRTEPVPEPRSWRSAIPLAWRVWVAAVACLLVVAGTWALVNMLLALRWRAALPTSPPPWDESVAAFDFVETNQVPLGADPSPPLQFSSDERRLLFGSRGRLHVYAIDWAEPGSLLDSTAPLPMGPAALHPSESLVACAIGDDTYGAHALRAIVGLLFEGGVEYWRIEGEGEPFFEELQFGPEGRYLLSTQRGEAPGVTFWDSSRGTRRGTFRHAGSPYQTPRSVFDSEGTRVATFHDGSQSLAVLSVPGAEVLRQFSFPNGVGPTAAAFSPDGRTLACATGQGEVLLWSLDDGREVGRFRVLPSHVEDMAFFREDSAEVLVALQSGIDRREVYLEAWDSRTGEELARCVTRLGNGPGAVSPRGTYIATGDRAGSIHIWKFGRKY